MLVGVSTHSAPFRHGFCNSQILVGASQVSPEYCSFRGDSDALEQSHLYSPSPIRVRFSQAAGRGLGGCPGAVGGFRISGFDSKQTPPFLHGLVSAPIPHSARASEPPQASSKSALSNGVRHKRIKHRQSHVAKEARRRAQQGRASVCERGSVAPSISFSQFLPLLPGWHAQWYVFTLMG